MRAINSLLGQKNSLFLSVGNLQKKCSVFSGIGGVRADKKAPNRENSLYFPCLTGNLGRDGFAQDCLHHH
jgi:hypothetical protein